MKTRSTYERQNHHSIWLRMLALLMCVLLGFSLVNIALSRVEADANTGIWGQGTLFKGTINLDEVYEQEDLDAAMHIIIRHWHSKDNPDATDEDTTVIVGAYIIPDEKNGNIVDSSGDKYTCYARAYISKDEPTLKGNKEKYVKVTTETQSNYISIRKSTVAAGDSVFFMANPFSNGDADNHVYYERFAGFSVSAGQPAVTVHNGTEAVEYSDAMLEINPAKVERMHLVKSHLFYISEMALVFGEEQKGNGTGDDFGKYEDTEILDKKYYNSSEGLHTDKTASESSQYGDGRTFDLDLEAWHNEGDPVNVGMVLDASGSMGFTANTPKPIKVFETNGDLNSEYRVPNNILTSLRNKKSSTNTLSNIFLTDAELKYFMNPRNTDNSSIRSSGYTYFLYDARTGTEEFTPLAYWDGSETVTIGSNKFARNSDSDVIIGQINYGGGAGWYYNNPSGNWETNYFNDDAQSGKSLSGIPKDFVITDKITLSTMRKPDLSGIDDYLNANYAKADTNRTYAPGADSPSKFYIDSAGYLRCLYYIASNNNTATGDVRFGSSYVYVNNDQDYIKVEALQRALGAFMTGLNTDSPESFMSAVRFSTPKLPTTDRYSLVLMDWTSDILDAQQVLSNQRGKSTLGDGSIFFGTKLGTPSDPNSVFNKAAGYTSGLDQYNYGLTGSTSTIQGLAAFETYLQGRLSTYENKTGKKGKKYLIIFTDGKDTDLGDSSPESTDAYKAANRLKSAGYTIFCVMLAGGPIKPKAEGTADGDYEKAYNFLKALGGPGLANGKPVTQVKDDKYVYSTAEHKDEGTGSNSVDSLVDIFTQANGILDKMTDDLEDYTIQDYIDPRFDLVDADGNVWELNANGQVVVNGAKYDLSGGKSTTFKLYNDKFSSNLDSLLTVSEKDIDDKIVPGAEEAELFYDSVKNMYYLKWTSQTIPTSYVGASRMKVWHSKLTVRAKDDFIGGNAVLTNGNDDTENFVYHEGDRDANSGVTDTVKSDSNEYPSKGFPRTTVNVTPGETNAKGDIEIYEGDDLDFTSIIKELIENALADDDYTTANFWEYVERFTDYYNEHPEHQDELMPKFSGLDDEEALKKLLDDDGKLSYEKLAEAIFDSESVFGVESTIELPYGYLPDSEHSNQTGLEDHEMDLMGSLTYGGTQTDDNGVYDKKDTNDRSFETEITFTPFDENTRKPADDKLISDGDYPWDSSFKESQGEEAQTETIPGTSNVTIVSGEITLQAFLSDEDIEALQKAGVTKISYTADLMHTLPDSDEPQKVGTFTVEITIDPETGEITQVTTIEYTDEYDFVRGSDGEKDNGLQFGRYTLTGGKTSYEYSDGSLKNTGPVKFGTPTVIQDDDAYVDDSFELDIKGKEDPWGHHGSLGNGEIELGEAKEDGTPNLNSRFGIFAVTGSPTYGDLSISKTVEGANDTDTVFTFSVELTPPYVDMFTDKALESFTCEYTYADGTTETKTLDIIEHEENGVKYYTATVELKHGDVVVIKDIPADVKYVVTEIDHDGYIVEAEDDTGIIVDEETQYAKFVNSPIALSVTKQVLIDPLRKLNNMPNLDNVYFDFVMVLSGDKYENITIDAIVLTYDEEEDSWIQSESDTITLEFVDNTATFQLRDGEGLMINGIPTGTDYTVREIISDESGFYFNHVDLGNSRFDDVSEDFDDNTSEYSYTVSRTISESESAAVHYFNSTMKFKLPLTGGELMTMWIILIGGIALSLTGIMVLILFLRRKRT